MANTIADRLAQRDADRFVGREAELAVFDGLFGDDSPASVLHVHGPGGIGKSALLREMARRAGIRGWTELMVDGRELAPVPGELEPILAAAKGEERPLLVFDTYERMSALDGYLRRKLLPELPALAKVVIAGREAPGPGWAEGGWEHVVRVMALAPLDPVDGRALVAARGVDDDTTATALLNWAEGSPLALGLAAEVARRDGGWSEQGLEEHPELVDLLVRRLAEGQVEGERAEVAAVASLARVTTAAMLADVLPEVDPNEAQNWLRARPTTERVGDGVAMHDLVRLAMRSHLRATRPERERDLRRRVADHLFTRAAAGEPRLMVDLAALIENPALRWGFGAEGAVGLHLDRANADELVALPAELRERGSDAWWSATEALVRGSAEHLVAARDMDDVLCGIAIAFTPANASPAALEDPFVGDWIRHAAANAPEANALVWRDSLDLTASERGDLSSRVLAILNTAAILRSGLVNPRWFYLPINPENEAAVTFARNAGARHVPELDVDLGDRVHECHVIDHGPQGMLGAQRAMIYAELGLPRPSGDGGPGTERAKVSGDDVRRALRSLDQPSELATNPLAAVTGGPDPAEAVRDLLVRAASDAFGSGPEEGLLRDVLVRGYLDHSTSHEAAAVELHLSRATYFRRLRQATDRVCDFVLATVTARGRPA